MDKICFVMDVQEERLLGRIYAQATVNSEGLAVYYTFTAAASNKSKVESIGSDSLETLKFLIYQNIGAHKLVI